MSLFALVGPGNLGRTLALSLPAETWQLGPVLSRDKVSSRRAVREMRLGRPASRWAELDAVPLILVATPARALAPTLAAAADQLTALHQKRILIAGVTLPDARVQVERLESMGASVGGVLPVAAYRRPTIVAPGATFAVWGAGPARTSARNLVKALRSKYVMIEPEDDVQIALAVGAAGLLTVALELALRRLAAAGFRRQRAIEALAVLSDVSLQEHRKARLTAPAPWLPANCADLLRAASHDAAELALYAQALELATEDLR
ncbi:MAG: hypothetical protein KDC27_06785 [Acidobacteria bacterium]|nr:hypothetical protein [Acidobacteriota bacterium]